MSDGQQPYYITRSVEREARKAVSQDLSSGELSNEEQTDTLGTDGTLQTNLLRGGNPEMAAEATTGDSVVVLLQYLIEKDERERQEKARSESDRLKLDEQRMELDREMHQKKCLQMVCQQLKTWDDSTDPEAYTDNFKLTMLEGKVPTADWVGIACKQLAGKVLTAFRELALETTTPYQDFKAAILKQLGATVEQARRTIWRTRPQHCQK